ncbi:MAG: hypothetical protein ACOZNI_02140 [Myxococcota bacterium]
MTVLWFLLGCPTAGNPVECDEETACAFGSVCVDGQCEAQTCATSDQCGIEYYCKDSACVAGCELDGDCRFGDYCDTETNTCAPSKCSDAHLDCEFGQFCSQIGECYDAGGYYCRPCEDHGDCGGGGNACYFDACQVACERQEDCPAGYVCGAIQDYNGNILGNYCYTSCE